MKAERRMGQSVREFQEENKKPLDQVTEPIGDRVMIRRFESDATYKESGIVIPDGAKEKPAHGEVVAVGKGRYDNGALIPMTVKVGDRVTFGKYAGNEVTHDGETFVVMGENDILYRER